MAPYRSRRPGPWPGRPPHHGADAAVSVTGVAGPDPDERGNGVGLVFIGLDTPEGTFCRRCDFGRRRRDRIQELAANHAFDLLRRYLSARL